MLLPLFICASAFAAESALISEKGLEDTASVMKPDLLVSDANVKVWALKHHCPEVVEFLGTDASLAQAARDVAAKRDSKNIPTNYQVPLVVKVDGYDPQRQLLLLNQTPVSVYVPKAPLSAIQKISLLYSKKALQPIVTIGNTKPAADPSQKCMAAAMNLRTTWPTSYSVGLSKPLDVAGIPMSASQAEALLNRLGAARTLSLRLDIRFTGLEVRPTAYGTSSEGIFTGDVESVSAFEDIQLTRFIGKGQ